MPRPLRTGPTVLAVLVLLTACGGAGTGDRESQPATTGTLTIDSHEDGDTVGTDSIQLRGTAPANAEIVQNIRFGNDKRTSADADGSWLLTVDLDEGDNDITLRIGSDDATSKTIRIIYDPELALASATASAEPPPVQTTAPPASTAPPPAPTAKPAPAVATFGGGDLIVGADVQPGTYRTRSAAAFCYWERVSGFGGALDDIIANETGSGYFTVTIGSGDAGFNSSGCGTWSADLSAVTNPAGPIDEDGTYIVGADIAPGTWRSDGGGGFGCYVARLTGFGGTLDEIISNDIATEGGLVVTVAATDTGFQTTGCGTWTKVN